MMLFTFYVFLKQIGSQISPNSQLIHSSVPNPNPNSFITHEFRSISINDSEKEKQALQRSNAKGKSAAKRKRAEKKTKSTTSSNHTKLRSWVWRHFTKKEHPLTEIVDGKEEVVGHTTRAQCKYCSTHLAANSNANGTSSLMKHIEQSCKSYPGKAIGYSSSHKRKSSTEVRSGSSSGRDSQKICGKVADMLAD
ncbi:hypothetical protein ACLB2K_064342 [Fragaria x ananassa]